MEALKKYVVGSLKIQVTRNKNRPRKGIVPSPYEVVTQRLRKTDHTRFRKIYRVSRTSRLLGPKSPACCRPQNDGACCRSPVLLRGGF